MGGPVGQAGLVGPAGPGCFPLREGCGYERIPDPLDKPKDLGGMCHAPGVFCAFDSEADKMTQYSAIKVFEEKRIRTSWDAESETWYYSIVDVVGILTGQPDTRHASNYWKVLKSRLAKEGCEVVTNCNQLKMRAEDGKMRLTDVADAELLLRIIQSIPSPKAEPFKQWLAQTGRERLEELEDPELAIDRALLTYRRKGYSESWINQRLKSIEIRKDLTDQWDKAGVRQGLEYASLTDIISQGWSGMTTRQYKALKGLHKENLRDNMSNMELILNMLAEATTTELSRKKNPQGFLESAKVAREGGRIAGNTRREIEEKTGIPVCTGKRGPNELEQTENTHPSDPSDPSDRSDKKLKPTTI